MGSVNKLSALAAAALLTLGGCSVMHHQESTGAYVDDTKLTAQVKEHLLRAKDVKGTEVKVQTYQGKVTLSGVVDNAEMARRAEEIARETPGVKDVESALRIAENSSTEGTPR